MSRPFLVATLWPLALAACAHPEDRRWKSVAVLPVSKLPSSEMPRARVYAFAPPKPDTAKPAIRDFSDRSQAAIVAALVAKASDPDALRKALATPLPAPSPANGNDDRTRLARTLVVSISKGPGSQPGDRLVRTIVTIRPAPNAGGKAFEFAGYTVAATDTKIQNIAHLEDQTDLALKGSLAPKIGGFGDNGVEASAGSTRKTSADIVQQYENLNVDIAPDELVLTRESERGLDVVGNTLIALTLAPVPQSGAVSAFNVSSQKLFDGGEPRAADKVTLTLTSLRMYPSVDLSADVTLQFVLRRVIAGREFYTEGKQRVQLVDGVVPAPSAEGTGRSNPTGVRQVLVRAADVQPPLYQVCADEPGHRSVMAFTPDGRGMLVTYDALDDARAMATWLERSRRFTIGKDGVRLGLSRADLLPAGLSYYAANYLQGCNPKPAAGRR